MTQARSNAVQERLDADEARLRVRERLRDQVLAAAEADFEDDSPSLLRPGGRGWGARRVERDGAACASF